MPDSAPGLLALCRGSRIRTQQAAPLTDRRELGSTQTRATGGAGARSHMVCSDGKELCAVPVAKPGRLGRTGCLFRLKAHLFCPKAALRGTFLMMIVTPGGGSGAGGVLG